MAPVRLAAATAACYPFVATTAWTALVHVAGVRPTSLPQWRLQAAAGDSGSGGSAGRALIHGAAGPVGLLACQLLRGWGYSVTATCKPSHDVTQLARFAQHVVTTQPDGAGDTESIPGWLSSVPALGSYSLFVDCVGGQSSEAAALSALSSPGGHFVSLRGALLPLLDADGLLAGAVSGAARLAERKAAFGARALRYDWAVNRGSPEALRYISAAIDDGVLEVTEPARVMRGIDSVPAAMQLYGGSERPQGKVVIELDQPDKAMQNGAPQQHRTARVHTV